MSTPNNPIAAQESMYDLPYHWFPEPWLIQYERNEKKRIIENLLQKHKSSKLSPYLDVGCGDGRWTYEISDLIKSKFKEPLESYGIDFSERAIAFAKLIKPEINFQVSAGEDILFPDNYFGLVSAIEVIEHVPDKSESKFLDELRRVTRPDGLIIITTPSWNLKVPERHFRHYTTERFAELAKATGLQLLETRGQSIPYYQPTLRKMRKLFANFPKVWRLWKRTYREVAPEKSLNLFFVLSPEK